MKIKATIILLTLTVSSIFFNASWVRLGINSSRTNPTILQQMKEQYLRPRFHENGANQNIPHNAQIGRDWMNEVFYSSQSMRAMRETIKPNGCNDFDHIYYVSTNGSDDATGSSSAPLATVQKAIDLANNSECTLINVSNGRYLQTFNIINKRNITIKGKNRVTTQMLSKKILDKWAPLTPDECTINRNCKIMKMILNPTYDNHAHILYKDKVSIPMISLAQYSFREIITSDDLANPSLLDEAEYINGVPNIYISSNLSELTARGKEKFKNHAIKIMQTDTRSYRYLYSGVMNRNDLTWDGVGSIYYVHPGVDKYGNAIATIYFKALDNDDEAYKHVSTHLGANGRISDSQNIVIQNLSLFNGRYGLVKHRDSHNVKIIGNIFSGHHRVIYAYGDQKNGEKIAPSNIEIYGNQITNNLDLNISPQFAGAYRNFRLVKLGLGDAHGINLSNVGANVNIHHNFIYNAGNGVQSSNDNKVDYQTIDLKVHHNLIINTLDDGLEPGGTCINCRWYANHLRNSSQAIRIKTRDRNSIGPVFIYNNVIYNQDKYDYEDVLPSGGQTTFYYHTASSVPIYVYNNLFMGFRCFLMPTQDSPTGAPNLYFLNNIFSCKYSMPNARMGYWPDPIENSANKNNQPLFSHNFVGGLQDSRQSITSSSGNVRELYATEMLHIFADNRRGRALNYVYRSRNAEPSHIFDSSNSDRTHILERTNFCPNQSPFSELLSKGLNLNDQENLSWQFMDKVPYENNILDHQIDRAIQHELPNFFDNIFPIGPFLKNQNCENFNWITNGM